MSSEAGENLRHERGEEHVPCCQEQSYPYCESLVPSS